MVEFLILLGRFGIVRSQDKELFHQVRQKLTNMRRTLRAQYGWETIRYRCRTSLVRVLCYAERMGLLKTCEGDTDDISGHTFQISLILLDKQGENALDLPLFAGGKRCVC